MTQTMYRIMQPMKDESAFIREFPSPKLPPINCWGVEGSCGGAARYGDIIQRIHKEIPVDDFLTEFQQPVSPIEFATIAAKVRELLELPENYALSPGNDIGRLRLKLTGKAVRDFEWPGVHDIVISNRVRELLIDEGFSGWRTEAVSIKEPQLSSELNVHELVVETRVSILVDPPFQLRRQCPVCGRLEGEWSVPSELKIDFSTWDGKDFFIAPPPLANRVFVTQRVKDIFTAQKISNIMFVPIDEVYRDGIANIQRSVDEVKKRKERTDAESRKLYDQIEALKNRRIQ